MKTSSSWWSTPTATTNALRRGLATAAITGGITALGSLAFGTLLTPADAANGNNGTVKVVGLGDMDTIPNNEPHQGCSLDLEWWNFDPTLDHATVSFTLQAPTRGTLSVSGDRTPSFTGGKGFDHREAYSFSAPGVTPAAQGLHVSIVVDTTSSHGKSLRKSKVIWITGCSAPSPSTSPSASPTCPPSVTPSMTPTPSETPSTTPQGSPSGVPSETPSMTASMTPSITPSVTPSVSTSASASTPPAVTQPSVSPQAEVVHFNLGGHKNTAHVPAVGTPQPALVPTRIKSGATTAYLFDDGSDARRWVLAAGALSSTLLGGALLTPRRRVTSRRR